MSVQLQDIATKLGISVSTVSRSLSNRPGIAASTRAAVLEEAKRCKYQPNAAARTLAHQRHGKSGLVGTTLAIFYGHRDRDPLPTHHTYRLCLEGAEEQARVMGFGLDPYWVHDPNLTPKRVKEILLARNTQGIILMAMGEDEISMPWECFSVVTIRNAHQETVFNTIQTDCYAFMRSAVVRLARKGPFKRPGLVITENYDRHRQQRITASFKAVLRELGLPQRGAVCLADQSEEVLAWSQRFRPDSVLFRYHKSVEPLIKRPNPPALFTIDRVEDNVEFPGVEQPWNTMGKESVSQLAASIAKQEKGRPESQRITILPAQWVEDPQSTQD